MNLDVKIREGEVSRKIKAIPIGNESLKKIATQLASDGIKLSSVGITIGNLANAIDTNNLPTFKDILSEIDNPLILEYIKANFDLVDGIPQKFIQALTRIQTEAIFEVES